MMGALVNGQNYQRGRRISVRVGAALISLLYKKSLSVDLSAVGQGVGAVNNLISVDLKEIQEFACYSQFLWCTVFEAIICLTLLFVILGPAALGGICVMLVAVPIGAYGTTKVDDYQSALLKDKDTRINVVQEAIQGIRVVKWFAWEDQIMEKISSARRKEVNSLRSYLIADALLRINWGLVPTLVGLASFLIHTSLMGKSLSPSVGYTSILLFNLLKSPVTIFPDMVNAFVRARVSLNRIQEYLDAADVSGLLPAAVPTESMALGRSDEVYSSRGIGIGIGKGMKIRPSMDLDLDRDLKGADADTLSSTLSHSNSGPRSSITITNASFGWAIQEPAEDDEIEVTKVKKGDWRFRFRSSTADPSISIASESERDDDESSESGFDSEGDYRVGGEEEESGEPEPSNQGRTVKAARYRNAWNRLVSVYQSTHLN
jgi:ABC-type multidrug transport system fused ATPase/permease subunit